jgi:hypothetical protein
MKDAPINLPPHDVISYPDELGHLTLAEENLCDEICRNYAERYARAAILADHAARAPQAGWEQDAKRYRALRADPRIFGHFNAAELDAAIDAAIAAAPNAQEE